MNSLISIVIVNYNGEKWLKKCLDSLSNQTEKNVEVIVVDNGSTDKSISLIKKYYKKYKLIINKTNAGFAHGNNIGIKNALGEFILLLNSDTWLESNFLTDIFSYYNQGNYDIVAPMENDYSNSYLYKYISKIDLLGHTVVNKAEKIEASQFFYKSGVCLFFRKKLYQDTKGFDSDFFMYVEDADWFWRLHLLQKKLGIAEHLCVHHAGAGSTGAGIKHNVFLWRNQNTLHMLLKNYAWYSLVWILPIYFIQNIVEILFFLLIFKPKIAFSYIEGWLFNIKNSAKIINKRSWIQHNRKITDVEVMKKMYPGFGKLKHLIDFVFS